MIETVNIKDWLQSDPSVIIEIIDDKRLKSHENNITTYSTTTTRSYSK